MHKTEFERTLVVRKKECEWCGKSIPAGTTCLVLSEDDEDYYFCSDECADDYSGGV